MPSVRFCDNATTREPVLILAALETSTRWCSVAIWRDGAIMSLERATENRHGEEVIPMLEELLQRAGLDVKALGAVAFGAGPGAFTGVRIACGVAQGLAFARGLPIVAVDSFEAMAEESGRDRVLACLDARMDEVYYCAMEREFSADAVRWRQVVSPVCVRPALVCSPEGAGWLGCGSGFSAHGVALRAAFGDALVAVRPEIRPAAAAIARLAVRRVSQGQGMDAADAAPFYLRDRVALTTEERRAK
jgi:tRNA threonylcarbamoyladenosine biosynthesis protein TsaB